MDVLCKSMFLENLIPSKLMIAVFLIKQHTVVFFFYDLLFEKVSSFFIKSPCYC